MILGRNVLLKKSDTFFQFCSDVKPENFLVSGEVAKLADLGFSVRADRAAKMGPVRTPSLYVETEIVAYSCLVFLQSSLLSLVYWFVAVCNRLYYIPLPLRPSLPANP